LCASTLKTQKTKKKNNSKQNNPPNNQPLPHKTKPKKKKQHPTKKKTKIKKTKKKTPNPKPKTKQIWGGGWWVVGWGREQNNQKHKNLLPSVSCEFPLYRVGPRCCSAFSLSHSSGTTHQDTLDSLHLRMFGDIPFLAVRAVSSLLSLMTPLPSNCRAILRSVRFFDN